MSFKKNIIYFIALLNAFSLTAQVTNNVYSWGRNRYGQLGTSDSINKLTPQRISNNFKFVSCGQDFSLAINQRGELFGCGLNIFGTCGDSLRDYYKSFKQIGTDTNWKFVSAGYAHALGINEKGELYGWGLNRYFALGLGPDSIDKVFYPKRIGDQSNWIYACAANNISFAINSRGELYSWGRDNNLGALGIGVVLVQNKPMRVGKDSNWLKVCSNRIHTIAINTKGQLFSWGNNRCGILGLGNYINFNTPQRVISDSNFINISAGWEHALAIKSNGEIYGWGRNQYGQLGTGNKIDLLKVTRIGKNSNWISVEAGYSSSLALTSNGELYSFGRNFYGLLGVGVTNDSTIPNRIGTDSSWTFISCKNSHCMAISNKIATSLGIYENRNSKNNQNEFSVYPNPCTKTLSFEKQKNINNETFKLIIVNAMGSEKMNVELDGLKSEIDVRGLTNGIYFYRIMGKSGGFFKGQFIVSK